MNFEDFFPDFQPLNMVNPSELSETSSMNLNIPLREEYVAPPVPTVTLNESAVVATEKKPRFRIVHGVPKPKPERLLSVASSSSQSSMSSSPERSIASVPHTPYSYGSFNGGCQVPTSIYHPYRPAPPRSELELKQHYQRAQEERKAKRMEKSVFTYPNMIFLALLNAPNSQAYVSDMYDFMTYNFPFFATAPNSWKNTVRNNLCVNKWFEKIPGMCLKSKGECYRIKPAEFNKLYESVEKIIRSNHVEKLKLRNPADIHAILSGRAGIPGQLAVINQFPPAGFVAPSFPINAMINSAAFQSRQDLPRY